MVKSKSSIVVAIGRDNAKINQKFKNSTRGKSNSTARKSTSRKKKTVSSKRTLDGDSDASDDSDVDYVPSRSLLRRNVAESGDDGIRYGPPVDDTGSLDAIEDDLGARMDQVQKHTSKLPRATEKPTPTVLADARKAQMELFGKEWPNGQPLVECPRPECRAVRSFTKAGTGRCGKTIKCSKCH